MIRNLKVLGLALVAVLAMGAIAASAASAGSFTSDAAVTNIVAGQVGEHEFVTNTGVVVCEVAHFTGEQEGETTATVTSSPLYTECEFQGLFSITVSVNGCDYVFHASSATEGTTDIAGCNESVPYIQVGSLATCRVRVQQQNGIGPISYTEVGNNVEINSEAEGISYSESGLFCAGGAVNNGKYFGLSVAEGNEGSANLGVEN